MAVDSGLSDTQSARAARRRMRLRPEAPEERRQGAVLFDHGQGGARVGQRRLDLEPVADDAGVGHQALAVGVAERRDRGDVEVRERRPERRPLAQDRQPREARLERLQREPLEQAGVRQDRPAPLLVVVADVLGRAADGPEAARPAVGAGREGVTRSAGGSGRLPLPLALASSSSACFLAFSSRSAACFLAFSRYSGPCVLAFSISSAPCFFAFSMISAASALALSVGRLGLLAQLAGRDLGLVGPLAGGRLGLVQRRARLLLGVGRGLLRLRGRVVGHLLGVVHESR